MRNYLESLVKSEKCCICGDIADGYHYGVMSCRGCNAFFRRTVARKMQFHCRHGGVCQVDKNARCACRACRFKKCEAMGMNRRAVQFKQANRSSQSLAAESPTQTSISVALKKCSDMPLFEIQIADGMFQSKKTDKICDERQINDCLVRNVESASFEMGLIKRLVQEYEKQRKMRRMMFCNSVEQILLDDDMEVTMRRPAINGDFVEIYKVQVVLMHEWVLELDEFEAIENPFDKAKLLRRFALRYILLDNVFNAVELGIRDRIVLVNNSYIVPGFDEDAKDASHKSVLDTKKLIVYGDNGLRMLEELIVPMIDMKFTVGELMALRLLLFWNKGGISVSSQTKTIMQEASDRAVNELHRWYVEQKNVMGNTRLGNVLLLLSSIADHVHYFTEIANQIPSFGQLDKRDCFLENILNS